MGTPLYNVYQFCWLIVPADARKLEEKIKKKGGHALSAVTPNLVDIVWGDKRPKPPNEKVKPHPIEFSGKESSEKIADLRAELEKKNAAGFIICMYFNDFQKSENPHADCVYISYA